MEGDVYFTAHIHLKLLLNKMNEFMPIAKKWADEMVKLGSKHAQKYELEKKHWVYLSMLDAILFKIYKLNKSQIKIILKRFEKMEKKIKEILKDWVDKYPKLIPKLPKYARYILPVQMRIYKYIN